MSRLLRHAAVAVSAFGLLTPLSLADEDADKARATALFEMLPKGAFAEFVAAGTDQMKAAMNDKAAAQLWSQLQFQLGAYGSIVDAKLLKTDENGMRTVTVRSRFERGILSMHVVLDSADRLAGLWMGGIEAANYEAPPYADKDKFEESPFTVTTGAFSLGGTLAIPKGDGPWPVVVLVHGSGPHDQDETIAGNKPFRDLAWGLASRGVAVVRYEKRTKKYGPQINPDTLTLKEETIDDACAAAAAMRDFPKIDKHRVFVLGHSLGGMAAPLIAEQDGHLAGAILMAGNARPLCEVIVEQLEYLSGLDGDVDADEQTAIDASKELAAASRENRVDDETPAVLNCPAVYWDRLSRADQVAVAARLDTPLLVLQGARDYQVTTEDFNLWRERLAKKRNTTFRLYDDLNHLMMTGKGKATPADYSMVGHVDVKVVNDIADWVKRQPPNEGK
ncbi:MAG: alpha/beta fold hydrolase [Phycisphaerales bacterium]|nr:alpha/beta fold hydrolase [Phycisphaerales bacterium]